MRQLARVNVSWRDAGTMAKRFPSSGATLMLMVTSAVGSSSSTTVYESDTPGDPSTSHTAELDNMTAQAMGRETGTSSATQLCATYLEATDTRCR